MTYDEMYDEWNKLSEDEQLKVLNLALDKYINHYSLIGTKSQAEYKLQQFKQMGVNEIACLIDSISNFIIAHFYEPFKTFFYFFLSIF